MKLPKNNMVTNFTRIVVEANVAHECFSQVNVARKSKDKNTKMKLK
jgi:hypothetical protein